MKGILVNLTSIKVALVAWVSWIKYYEQFSSHWTCYCDCQPNTHNDCTMRWDFVSWSIHNLIDGVVVSVPATNVVDRGYSPGQVKPKTKIDIFWFSAKLVALRLVCSESMWISCLLNFWIFHVQCQSLGPSNICWATKIVILESPAGNGNKKVLYLDGKTIFSLQCRLLGFIGKNRYYFDIISFRNDRVRY
jgi:hypothetical protein